MHGRRLLLWGIVDLGTTYRLSPTRESHLLCKILYIVLFSYLFLFWVVSCPNMGICLCLESRVGPGQDRSRSRYPVK